MSTRTAPAPRTKASALVGLAIAFAWPLLLALRGAPTLRLTNARNDIVDLCVKSLVVIALAVIAFRIQRRAPSELGMRRLGWRGLLAAFAGTGAAFLLSGAVTRFVALPSSLTDLRSIAAVPLGVRVAVVLGAAITEEFIYRGFAIEELNSLTGRRWLAGLISLIMFTVPHARLYGMSAALIVPGLIGAVLTALYLWRRNLSSCMLMHALVDGYVLIALPLVLYGR